MMNNKNIKREDNKLKGNIWNNLIKLKRLKLLFKGYYWLLKSMSYV